MPSVVEGFVLLTYRFDVPVLFLMTILLMGFARMALFLPKRSDGTRLELEFLSETTFTGDEDLPPRRLLIGDFHRRPSVLVSETVALELGGGLALTVRQWQWLGRGLFWRENWQERGSMVLEMSRGVFEGSRAKGERKAGRVLGSTAAGAPGSIQRWGGREWGIEGDGCRVLERLLGGKVRFHEKTGLFVCYSFVQGGTVWRRARTSSPCFGCWYERGF